MLDSVDRRLILAGCTALILAFSYGAWRVRKIDNAIDAAISNSSAVHEIATAGQAKGEVYDQAIAARDPEVQAAKAEYERDRIKYSLIRGSERPVAPVPPASVVPGDSPDGRNAGGDSVAGSPDPELLAARELISSQAAYIKALEGKVATLELSVLSWRGTALARAQEIVQKDAVIAAQQGLIKGALLKGRIQGFAVGLGSGYLAGKL